LKVLDPACGSGSFLLQAYQYLLDWYLDQYSQNPKKWKDRIVRTGSETFSLSSRERSRILLNNIYGVDIDSQAVEVTKLSLLLKALEKTPGEAIDLQLRLLHERALPDLEANIKRGNSIVGSDFYSTRQTTLLEPVSDHAVDVFQWEREFPPIFERPDPGFDVIIGNPP
ncbi:type II restriction enzyme, methylase subunit, partial [mine drainage metagenome]